MYKKLGKFLLSDNMFCKMVCQKLVFEIPHMAKKKKKRNNFTSNNDFFLKFLISFPSDPRPEMSGEHKLTV